MAAVPGIAAAGGHRPSAAKVHRAARRQKAARSSAHISASACGAARQIRGNDR